MDDYRAWTLVGSGTVSADGTVSGRGQTRVATGPALDPGEAVEVVTATQLRGAVSSALAQADSLMDALERDLNDVGPFGSGYRRALADLREQLRLRFGGR